MAKNLLDIQYEKLNTAYESTIYRCTDLMIDLRIGLSSNILDQFLLEKGCPYICILTAMNPRSETQAPELNQQLHNQLMEELDLKRYKWKNGVNLDPKGQFPAEKTCWVLGMTEAEGKRYGKNMKQNAYVYYPVKGIAQLIWVFRPGQ